MAADSTHVPRPPAQAEPPRETIAPDGTAFRNARPERDAQADASGEEPRVEDLGARSFAGQNMAADQRRQAEERGAGLGAGGSDLRDARHGPGPDDREVPEDDLD
jgi:hypothetical protein